MAQYAEALTTNEAIFKLESFAYLQQQGVKYHLKTDTLRVHQKYNGRCKQNLKFRRNFYFCIIALIAASVILHGAYPNWFAWPFFAGILSGVAMMVAFGLLLRSRERQRSLKEATAFDDMLVGVDGDIMWLGFGKKIFRFFLSPAAFKSIQYNGDYIYANILTGGTIIVEQSILLQSEQGKAVHAWLSRAKAEIDFGGR